MTRFMIPQHFPDQSINSGKTSLFWKKDWTELATLLFEIKETFYLFPFPFFDYFDYFNCLADFKIQIAFQHYIRMPPHGISSILSRLRTKVIFAPSPWEPFMRRLEVQINIWTWSLYGHLGIKLRICMTHYISNAFWNEISHLTCAVWRIKLSTAA